MDLISYRPLARDCARAALTTLFALGSITGCAAATDVSAGELAGQPQPLAAGPGPIVAIPIGCPIFATCFTVINTNDSGAGSLRQAILDANAAAGRTVIKFNIPGAGKQVIRPQTYLPFLQGDTTVDGYSQPGALPATDTTPAVLKVVLDGGQCANFCNGLVLEADDNVVRGLAINDFAPGNGIVVESDENIIQGNILGAGVAALVAIPNGQSGVNVNSGSGNLIGGPQPDDRNIIAGNGVQGIILFSDDNEVYGNAIGTNWDGSLALGNGGSGVEIYGDGNRVGGMEAGEPNVIAYNGGDGITVVDGSANTLAHNALYDNEGLAIDLGANDVTLNDGPLDPDVGANGLQNFPEIDSVALDPVDVTVNGHKTEVAWHLESAASHKFRIEFYVSPSCDPSGYGEAMEFLGSYVPNSDGTGLIDDVHVLPGRVFPGEFVTMLATDLGPVAPSYDAADTSELSKCVEAVL